MALFSPVVNCVAGCIHKNCSGDLVQHVDVTETNPSECRPTADAMEEPHRHGLSCGHEVVQHGDHLDFLVDSHLHHLHGNHCDDHGVVDLDALLWFDVCHCPPGTEVSPITFMAG